jgi:hypothetical protein
MPIGKHQISGFRFIVVFTFAMSEIWSKLFSSLVGQDLKNFLSSLCGYEIRRAGAYLLLCLLAVIVARADDAAAPRYFDIPAQRMDAALIEFSEQADIQLMIATELVENLNSRGIRGRYVPEDALTLLIVGTNLTFHAVGQKAIAIVRDDGA